MELDRTSSQAMPESGSNGNGAGGPTDDETRREVATRLRDLGQRIAPAVISDIWVFPPLSHLEGSTEFLLFTRFLPDEMRHLCGAEFTDGNGNGNGKSANGNGNGNDASAPPDRVRRITEYGAVPSHRVPGVVAGVRARLGEHLETVHVEIGGLQPNRDYWYRFTAGKERSITGRARTTPAVGAAL
ncbi:MAG: PhoD-like phosphatase N-terminal domain-containing protein, partial [Gemmatimonadales bacterium]